MYYVLWMPLDCPIPTLAQAVALFDENEQLRTKLNAKHISVSQIVTSKVSISYLTPPYRSIHSDNNQV